MFTHYYYLTHCGLVKPYGDMDLVNIGLGNCLLPDGTKSIPEPILTNLQWGFVAFTWYEGNFTRHAHEINPEHVFEDYTRAVTSTDFRNRLTVPPNSNRIRLTERFASPYGALCFHMFMGNDSPPGLSRLSLQVLSLLVSNQTSFTQIKRQSKIITCGVLM